MRENSLTQRGSHSAKGQIASTHHEGAQKSKVPNPKNRCSSPLPSLRPSRENRVQCRDMQAARREGSVSARAVNDVNCAAVSFAGNDVTKIK